MLLTFCDSPAEHWLQIRTTNPIESVFATVRLRHDETKGNGSRSACLAMVYKRTEHLLIAQALERNGWNRLRAAAELGISRMTLYKKLHKYGLMDV